MTAYELRRHLAAEHDIHMAGADYGALLTLHDVEHRLGIAQDHEHKDGPNPAVWVRDCADFGCDEAH